jgi:hypothetical protein
MRISRVLTAKTNSISGTEVDLLSIADTTKIL